ncbi:MAG: hypothetical protein LC800_18420 [Acidobacteria bacterium]|nr:hypothetical protein [Acidobacteriota bacterium]
MPTDIQVVREGDTGKPDPFTIAVIANPALEQSKNTGVFIVDPITSDRAAFDACAAHIDASLFGGLPGQGERFLGDPSVASQIRVFFLFATGLPAQDGNALVANDNVSTILEARRARFTPFLATFGLRADVAFAVTKSATHNRASAWPATDDDSGPGDSFTLDGVTLSHRHRTLIPGTSAIHSGTRSLTALHEFGHALGSFSNGLVVDLYVDNQQTGVNNRRGRPIPVNFAAYDGVTMRSDNTRDGIGYPANWSSYHCELLDPAAGARRRPRALPSRPHYPPVPPRPGAC